MNERFCLVAHVTERRGTQVHTARHRVRDGPPNAVHTDEQYRVAHEAPEASTGRAVPVFPTGAARLFDHMEEVLAP